MSRALKAYRKDVRDRNGKTKKIAEFSLRVRRERRADSKEEGL